MLTPVMRKLLSTVYLRSSVYKLKTYIKDYVEYAALHGHIITFGLHKATTAKLLDIESLPANFKLLFVGPAHSFSELHERIRKLKERSHKLPIASREVARIWVEFFKLHSLPYLGDLAKEPNTVIEERLAQIPENAIPNSIVASMWCPSNALEEAKTRELELTPDDHAAQHPRVDEDADAEEPTPPDTALDDKTRRDLALRARAQRDASMSRRILARIRDDDVECTIALNSEKQPRSVPTAPKRQRVDTASNLPYVLLFKSSEPIFVDHTTYDYTYPLGDMPLTATGMIDMGGTDNLTTEQQSLAALYNLTKKHGYVAKLHDGVALTEYNNPTLLERAFPDCFLGGFGGPENESEINAAFGIVRNARPRRQSFEARVKGIVRHYSKAFVENPEFAWDVTNMVMRRENQTKTRFIIKRGASDVTIKEALDNLRTAHAPEPGTSDAEIARCRAAARSFNRQIQIVGSACRGSPYERRSLRANITANHLRFTPYGLFITVNPPDGFDARSVYLCDGGLHVNIRSPMLAKAARAAVCSENPLGSALYFDRIIRAYIEAFIETTTGRQTPFGTHEAHIGSVEEQGRKAAHLHLIMFISELCFGKLQHELGIGDDPYAEARCQRLFAYIERVVSQRVPPLPDHILGGVVANPAADAIQHWDQDDDQDDDEHDVMSTSRNTIQPTTPKTAPLPACDDADSCGKVKLKIDPKERVVTIVRDHGMLVSHNCETTAAFPSNQCIEMILDGPDALTKAIYVTNYVTKNGMTEEDFSLINIAALETLSMRIDGDDNDNVDDGDNGDNGDNDDNGDIAAAAASMDPIALNRKMILACLNRASKNIPIGAKTYGSVGRSDLGLSLFNRVWGVISPFFSFTTKQAACCVTCSYRASSSTTRRTVSSW